MEEKRKKSVAKENELEMLTKKWFRCGKDTTVLSFFLLVILRDLTGID